MTTSKQFTQFILEHAGDDTSKLLFSAARYPEIDIRKAALAIEARRKARTKLPSWFDNPEIEYPDSLSMEQCSSQATALYKRRFVPEGGTIADITGGLGVDISFLADKASQALYIERNPALCEAARHNFELLGHNNITIINSETSPDNLPQGHFDLIYADPARRSKTSSRVYSIADCEPDILSLKESLLKISSSLLVKISPMADIVQTLRQFPEASELHVVSSDGEVKELLVYCRKGSEMGLNAGIYCTEISAGGESSTFRMSLQEEAESVPSFADGIGRYLFLPEKGVLKAGAFRLCSSRFGIKKLAPSTHLYTADEIPENFPGRIYEVSEVCEWGKASASEISRRYPAAGITAVNFPVSTDELRKKLKIKEGGKVHIFVTTLKKSKYFVICSRFKSNKTTK